MTRILDAAFVSSAASLASLPAESLPEVAFAGRSNVGKSSLLNRVANRRGLFRVSATPGCTRTINHFRGRLEDRRELFLVDLPGYGYARVPKALQTQWGPLVETYLVKRRTLVLVVVIVDARRGLEQEERDLLAFLDHHERPALLVATKLDKVPSSKRAAALGAIRRQSRAHRVVGFSARTGEGADTIVEAIASQITI